MIKPQQPLQPSLISRPSPSFIYPTSLTSRQITQARQRAFQRFLDLPTKGSFIENHQAMLRGIRLILSKCQPEIAQAALKAVDYFEKIYPDRADLQKDGEKGNVRSDGTLERCHPLAVAWWLAYAGSPADVIIAALYHDAIEDGKLTSFGKWCSELGVECGSKSEAFLYSAWRKISILTRPPVIQDGVNLNKELHSLLHSPKDLKNPRVQEILSILAADQDNYVMRIYRSVGPSIVESEGITTAIIKVFDTLYNTKSLVYLDPKKEFSRFYGTLRKAFSHLEPLKKLNYDVARQILLSIGRALHRLAVFGIGPAEIPDMHQFYWYHVCQQSPYQRFVEHKGFADCGLRSVFDPDKNSYARTVISKFGPEPKDALLLIGTPSHPPHPMEFEVPLYVRNEPWWHFFNNTFRQIDVRKLEKAIKKAFPAKKFSIKPQPSYLPPLLGTEFLIWRFEPPAIIRLLEEKIAKSPSHPPNYSDLLSDNIMREFERFDRRVRRGLRYIYKHAVRRPALLHYSSFAVLLAKIWASRFFGICPSNHRCSLPDEKSKDLLP
jgi:hypothetical protein